MSSTNERPFDPPYVVEQWDDTDGHGRISQQYARGGGQLVNENSDAELMR